MCIHAYRPVYRHVHRDAYRYVHIHGIDICIDLVLLSDSRVTVAAQCQEEHCLQKLSVFTRVYCHVAACIGVCMSRLFACGECCAAAFAYQILAQSSDSATPTPYS